NEEKTNNKQTVKVERKNQKYKASIKTQSEKVADAQLTVDGRLFTIRYTPENTKEPINVQGYISHDTPKRLIGKNFHKDGTTSNWSAKQVENATAKTDTKAKDSKTPEIEKVLYPFVAYGNEELPEVQDVLFKNVTAWTNEEEGILENVDVHIRNGKIHAIGENLSARGKTKVIDGT